jgi:hypothetical protein
MLKFVISDLQIDFYAFDRMKKEKNPIYQQF